MVNHQDMYELILSRPKTVCKPDREIPLPDYEWMQGLPKDVYTKFREDRSLAMFVERRIRTSEFDVLQLVTHYEQGFGLIKPSKR